MAGLIAKQHRTAVETLDTIDARRAAAALFLLAATGLAFQVALTRIFSLLFQYHYVFLVVSLAILGLGLGAAAGYVALQTALTRSGDRALIGSTLTLAVLFPITAFLLTRVNSADLSAFAVMVAVIPFLVIGWLNALVYARFSAHSNLIYGADLIGAALGPVVALILLPLLGPVGTALAMGTLAALAGVAVAAGTFFMPVAAVILAVLIALTGINRASGFMDYDAAAITSAPPDKTMVRVLQSDRNARLIDTRWVPFAQVDVVSTSDPDARFVFTDAGAGSIMLRDDPAIDLSWIDREVASLPFATGAVDSVLVIGAGAGYDVVMARQAGAESVTAVEVNPAMVDITRSMADYNGGILDLPGVTTVVADGRSFVDHDSNLYDLVYLNVVYSQAAAPAASSLVENNIFTVEALRAYWQRLADNGRIAFVTHNGLEGVRLLMTALKALEAEGIPLTDALAHTALVMTANAPDPTNAPAVLIVNRQPWQPDDAQTFSLRAAQRGMQPMYIPHRAPEALQVLLEGTMTLDQYIAANTDYNIFPTTDSHPFFYNLDPGLPPALRTLLTLSALLTTGYFIIAAALQPKKARHEWTRVDLIVYFGLLGAGFMLIEVALLQRFSLLLGDPVLSLAVTLGALLLGAGLGSLFSRRFTDRVRVVTSATTVIGLAAIAAVFVYPALASAVLPTALIVRVIVTILALLPLGFVMGMPFPAGLRVADEADPAGIPLFWGMNAIASTLGAVLATVLALLAGYHVALLAGALVYGAAALLVGLTWRRVVAF